MFHRGDVIRKLREERGWSQPELAKRAKLNKSTIVRIEENDPTVRLDTVQAVAQALGRPLADLEPVTSPVTGTGHKIAVPPGALTIQGQEPLAVADSAQIRLQRFIGSLNEADAEATLEHLKGWLGARWAGQAPSKK